MADDQADFFTEFPASQREALRETFSRFVHSLPGGLVTIAWGMPSIKVGTTTLVSLSGFDRHNSVFPGPEVITLLAPDLHNHTVTKGTIHFDKDRPMSTGLVRKISRTSIAVLNSRFPKKDGTFVEYYDNGWLKQRGKYRDGLMHGRWEWFRRDGSPMRSGEFLLGDKTGEWTTFTRDGGVV